MRRRLRILEVVFLSLCLTACTPNGAVNSQPQGSEREDAAATKIEITLEDAIALAQKEADQYYSELKLTKAYSYDNDEAPDIQAGENGARQWWYVHFANEALNYVVVLIEDGVIIQAEHFDENGHNGLIEGSAVKMTAQEAVQRAKKLGLRGGDPENADKEWVSGYNFNLAYGSLVKAPDDERIMLEVIGISPDGNFAHVDFDALTGELLLAEEKIEHADGSVEWKAF